MPHLSTSLVPPSVQSDLVTASWNNHQSSLVRTIAAAKISRMRQATLQQSTRSHAGNAAVLTNQLYSDPFSTKALALVGKEHMKLPSSSEYDRRGSRIFVWKVRDDVSRLTAGCCLNTLRELYSDVFQYKVLSPLLLSACRLFISLNLTFTITSFQTTPPTCLFPYPKPLSKLPLLS